MHDEWITLLSKITLFDGINEDDLRMLVNCFVPKICKYQKDEYIAIAGEKLEGIGCLIEGQATIAKENAAGNRVIITTLKAGDIFGEMAAFAHDLQWPATIYAQSDCTVFFLPPHKVVEFCAKVCPFHKILLQNVLKIMSEKALILANKVDYLSIKSMRVKISTFLLEQYDKTGSKTFTLPINRNELADLLNVSRPSMSREMGRMRDEGLIEFYRSSIRIVDIEALKLAVTSNDG